MTDFNNLQTSKMKISAFHSVTKKCKKYLVTKTTNPIAWTSKGHKSLQVRWVLFACSHQFRNQSMNDITSEAVLLTLLRHSLSVFNMYNNEITANRGTPMWIMDQELQWKKKHLFWSIFIKRSWNLTSKAIYLQNLQTWYSLTHSLTFLFSLHWSNF